MEEAVYARCLAHARRVCPPDPAIEAEDLVHAAYLKVSGKLDTTRPEYEQAAYLKLIIGQLATDRTRRYARHPRLPLEDWCPSPRDPEAEALARVELGAVLAAVLAGDLFAAAALAMALLGAGEAAAALGVDPVTLRTRAHRWRRAQMEA